MTDINTTTAEIDTSKLKLDIAVHGRTERWQVANSLPGWRFARLQPGQGRRHPCWYRGDRRIRTRRGGALRATDFVVLVLQPMQVKAFARVHLRRAKNDALDAILIAACAAAIDQPRIAPDPRLADLARYLTFIEQIEEDIVRFKTQLEHIDEPRLRSIISSDIRRLKARRTAQLRIIAKHLRGHDDLASRLELVMSIPGIGERTALALIIRMPELGRISREEAAALAGLAPFDDDSGQHKGQRHIAGGRGRLRRSLFAAALPAAFPGTRRWSRSTYASQPAERPIR